MYRWSIQGPGASFLSSLGILAVVGMGAHLLQTEPTFTSGKFFAFLLYTNMFYEPVRQLVSIITLSPQVRHQGKGFLKFSIRPIKSITMISLFSQKAEKYQFEKVSFSWWRSAIIEDLSFTIPEGSTTALVGATGAGKSTTANLLLRYYNVTAGQIRIGNENLEKLSLLSETEYWFGGTGPLSFWRNWRTFFWQILLPVIKTFGIPLKLLLQRFRQSLPEQENTTIGGRGIRLSMGEKHNSS